MIPYSINDITAKRMEEPQKERKRKATALLLLMLALILFSFLLTAYTIYKNREEKDTLRHLQVEILESNHSLVQLSDKYHYSLNSGDSAFTRIDSLQNALHQSKEEMKNVYRQMLQSNGLEGENVPAANNGQLLREKILSLNETIDVLLHQIDSLKIAGRLVNEKQIIRDTIYVTNTTVIEKEAAPQPVNSSGIAVSSVQLVMETSRDAAFVRRSKTPAAARVKLSFIVTDSNTVKTPREFFALLLGPKANKDQDNNVNPIYTARIATSRNDGKPVEWGHTWILNPKFKAGDYKMELYSNGIKMAQTSIRIKKTMKTPQYID
jgi:hypothetical protein